MNGEVFKGIQDFEDLFKIQLLISDLYSLLDVLEQYGLKCEIFPQLIWDPSSFSYWIAYLKLLWAQREAHFSFLREGKAE